MFLGTSSGESYWNSYRLLESELIRLSHAIRFDDTQVDVYSSELADIISSSCIKIESLAKDIYEAHIWPFQLDSGMVPKSFKGSDAKFNPEKWTRWKWKYDHHCLIEIDNQFLLSQKRVTLKAERFHFHNFGNTILPFNNIAPNDCRGGSWEHIERDVWGEMLRRKLVDVDWCKSYQAIKHSYIQSIPLHGTVKTAIMVLSAFYLLAIYNSCLPSKCFDLDYKKYGRHSLDFGSELFSCGMYNQTFPPFVINSQQMKDLELLRKTEEESPHKSAFADQNRIFSDEGTSFHIALNQEVYREVKKDVDAYCRSKNIDVFDIAPYEVQGGLSSMDEGALLYLKIKKYICPPYNPNNLCIAFSPTLDRVYNGYCMDSFDYEKSKHEKQNKETLSTLQIGDFIDAEFAMDTKVSNGEVRSFNENTIELYITVDGHSRTLYEHIGNIIYIKKRSQPGKRIT